MHYRKHENAVSIGPDLFGNMLLVNLNEMC